MNIIFQKNNIPLKKQNLRIRKKTKKVDNDDKIKLIFRLLSEMIMKGEYLFKLLCVLLIGKVWVIL